jgi:hypothetical protein
VSEARHVSDWKPCTIIRGPLKLAITGGDEYERKALADLVALMLKETRLTAKVTLQK